MINNIVLVGRITKDPELKKTQNGKSVVSFTLAVNRKYKQEGQQDADFVSCVAWNNQAEFIGNYITKGRLLGVEGRLQTRNYEDNAGRNVKVTEVVIDSVQALESRPQETSNSSGTHYPSYPREDEPILDITSDDLPF